MSHIYPDPMPTSFTAVGQTGPYQPQLQRPMSNQVNDGGPAFPQPDLQFPNGEVQYGSPGMTLRDYFAAAALQGLLADGGGSSWEADAKNAYQAADAMLKAREVKL